MPSMSLGRFRLRFASLMRGSEGGVVLLDFSPMESKSSSSPLSSVSGYRMGNIVLTVAPYFLTNRLKSLETKDVNYSVKVSCYWLDGVSVKTEHLVQVWRIFNVKLVERAMKIFKNSNLKQFVAEGDISHSLQFDGRFMLLKLGDEYIDNSAMTEALKKLSDYSKSRKLTHGQEVFTWYAPFGVNEFMNSCSRGCLSNKFNEVLFLIDGRLAPGCEGAPVYTKSDASNYPIGIVLFPIAVGNDHSSYSVAVPIHYVTDAFLSTQKSDEFQTVLLSQSFLLNGPRVRDGVNNVVIVETPKSWGSGIVVGTGLAVTNAHVIGFSQESAVTIRWGKKSISARVLFHSVKSSLLDVAVLQYNKAFGPPGIRFSRRDPEVGESVLAVGNPLQICSDVPSLSKGAVLNYWKKSAGFSTSCIMNAGSSGGAIVREDGTLLGMVVGICRSNKLAYPEINICICASVLQEPLIAYLESGDVSCLRSLLTYDDSWLRAVMRFPKSKY